MQPEIYKIMQLGQGFLAMMARPRSGDWIEDEFSGLAALRIGQVVSLLEIAEENYLGLSEELHYCDRNGMRFVRYPIVDRGLPESRREFARLGRTLHADIVQGVNTVVHCRGGIGRSGLLAATVLLHAGYAADTAIKLLSDKCGVSVPDTDEQYDWLVRYQRKLLEQSV